MSDKEPLGCPICGGDAEFKVAEEMEEETGARDTVYGVRCYIDECWGYVGVWSEDESEAIRDWNNHVARRTPSPSAGEPEEANASLGADSARLDWLAERSRDFGDHAIVYDSFGYAVMEVRKGRLVPLLMNARHTLREAIDAARTAYAAALGAAPEATPPTPEGVTAATREDVESLLEDQGYLTLEAGDIARWLSDAGLLRAAAGRET